VNSIRWLLQAIERHKDAALALGALLAPFAAVFVGLRASKRQADAALDC